MITGAGVAATGGAEDTRIAAKGTPAASPPPDKGVTGEDPGPGQSTVIEIMDDIVVQLDRHRSTQTAQHRSTEQNRTALHS